MKLGSPIWMTAMTAEWVSDRVPGVRDVLRFLVRSVDIAVVAAAPDSDVPPLRYHRFSTAYSRAFWSWNVHTRLSLSKQSRNFQYSLIQSQSPITCGASPFQKYLRDFDLQNISNNLSTLVIHYQLKKFENIPGEYASPTCEYPIKTNFESGHLAV